VSESRIGKSIGSLVERGLSIDEDGAEEFPQTGG
jgi:hypothetical protein